MELGKQQKSENNESEQQIVIYTFSNKLIEQQQEKEISKVSIQQNKSDITQGKQQNQVQKKQNQTHKQLEQISNKQQIMISSYQQRKIQNIFKLKNYQSLRTKIYANFLLTLENILIKLRKKYKQIDLFFTELKDYFLILKQTYKSLIKNFQKLPTLSYKLRQKQLQTQKIQQGLTYLNNFKKLNIQKSKNLAELIQKQQITTLLQLIKSQYNYMTEQKQVFQNTKKKYNEQRLRIQQKIQKICSKQDQMDILQQQIELIRMYNKNKQKLEGLGKRIYKIYNRLKQLNLLKQIKEKVEIVLQEIKNFHYYYDQFQKANWHNVLLNYQNIFEWISTQNSIKQLLAKQSINQNDLRIFFHLQFQQNLIGKPEQIIRNLYIKKYRVNLTNLHKKIHHQQTQQLEVLFDAKLYLSTQSNIILQIPQQPIIKINFKNIQQINKVGQLSLQLISKEKGLILRTTNKQIINFRKLDECEQFIYMITDHFRLQ